MYNRFNLGRHLVSAKIIDIFDCEPLAWLWRGFGVALAWLWRAFASWEKAVAI
jgi:hypothetical protein